jgi:hypothetical protein
MYTEETLRGLAPYSAARCGSPPRALLPSAKELPARVDEWANQHRFGRDYVTEIVDNLYRKIYDRYVTTGYAPVLAVEAGNSSVSFPRRAVMSDPHRPQSQQVSEARS